MIIISLLILIALLYFNKTHLKENIQNIDNLPNNSQQSNISIASTGVNNVVDLINSTKQKNVTNVDYNNRIEQKEINYDDGNTLMNTYSKIYPLRKDEIQLDNTLSEYKEENSIEVIKFAQVANGILLPVIAIFLLIVANNKKLLKKQH